MKATEIVVSRGSMSDDEYISHLESLLGDMGIQAMVMYEALEITIESLQHIYTTYLDIEEHGVPHYAAARCMFDLADAALDLVDDGAGIEEQH